ncbi:MAG TPA: globin [Candidatus Limnocylindrales bacterium]|nr:globin [Candidatus Limnocylindrales bacterium]
MRQLELFEVVGGMPFFEQLVDRFYEGVASDPILRPLYPEPDLAGARHRLTLFLAQYWGGPATYSEERGHPRLRMRHMPFAIGGVERDRWLLHMRAAIEASDAPEEARARLNEYVTMAAEAMRNRPDESVAG